jgi:predicted metalloendopeptidase
MERILKGDEDATIGSDDILQKAKNYFQSCMGVDKIVEDGLEPILQLAQEIMDKSSETSPAEMLGWLHSNAIFAFFRGINIRFIIVNYGKVEGHDPKDPRLQILPNVAYKIDSQKVAELLSPFVETGFIPSEKLDDISSWIAALEEAMVQFVEGANVARKADSRAQNDDQFVTLDEFAENSGVDLNVYLEAVGLSGVDKVFLYGEAELWYTLFKGTMKEERFQDMQYYYLFRLAICHFNKLSPKYYNLHHDILHTQSKAVRRHGIHPLLITFTR